MNPILWWSSLAPNTKKTIGRVFVAIVIIIAAWWLVQKVRGLFAKPQTELPENCEPQDSDFTIVDQLQAAYEGREYDQIEQIYGSIGYSDECVCKRYANAWNKRWKGKGGGLVTKPYGNLYESIKKFGCDTGWLDWSGINNCTVMEQALKKLEQYNLTTL